jgi:SP family general alpha glucoside:H+ symporter-like MFS transporter
VLVIELSTYIFYLTIANLCYSNSHIMGESGEDKPTVLSYAEDCVNIDQPEQKEEHSEKALIAEAQVGFADEKELGPLAALKAYSNAVLWSLVFAACVIMEGYDTALLGSFYAYRMGTVLSWTSGC